MIDIDHIGAAAFVVALREDGAFVYEGINPPLARLTGLSPEAIVGRSPAECFAPDMAAMLTGHYRQCIEAATTMDFEHEVTVPLGTIVTRTTLTPLRDAGPCRRLLGVSIDTTEQHRLREDLKRTNARLAIALDALGGANWYYDANDRSFELSDAFDRLCGAKMAGVVSLDRWLDRVHPDDRDDTCFADILAGRREQGIAEFRVVADDGEVRWLRCRRRAVSEQGAIAGIAGIVIDVTQEKRREAALNLQAQSDALTGLPNRRRFEEKLAAERERAARRGGALSLLMIDVDHFKLYNDTYGHIGGDAALRRLARCIRAAVEAAGGLAARYGGEEFVAVLPGLDADAARSVAAEILAEVAAMGEPHRASPRGILSVSIGIGAHPRLHRGSSVDLLALADAALYRAKHDGRGCLRLCLAPARAERAAASSAA